MEDHGHNEDVKKSAVKPLSSRSINQKPTSSGKSTPRSTSPTFQKLHSLRTRGAALVFQRFRSTRIVYWLILITLWAYAAFYTQSRWAHNDGDEGSFIGGFGQNLDGEALDFKLYGGRSLISSAENKSTKNGNLGNITQLIDVTRISGNVDVALAREDLSLSHLSLPSNKKRSQQFSRASRGRSRGRGKRGSQDTTQPREAEVLERKISAQNSTYGLLVGPFGSAEDRVLKWSPDSRTGTCDRQEMFGEIVRSREFVLIFHELSMTGAPISMLELATELLSCGATVHAVVLTRRGGLMTELSRRRIPVIDDKGDRSFRISMKADLIIAGSAVCAQWIEKYLTRNAAGANQIAWWIMENRLEYFERSKAVLGRVKTLMFLSELQSKQWLAWCRERNIKLTSQIALIPLSVNDELAFVAGIPSTLNTPILTPEKMLERRQRLRNAVRKDMGLKENDMLVMSLSSISAAKGQLLLLETANMIINEQTSQADPLIQSRLKSVTERSNPVKRARLRGLLQEEVSTTSDMINRRVSRQNTFVNEFKDAKELNSYQELQGQNLKVLIGSVGSKSNKAFYLKQMLELISENPKLAKSVLWVPATTRVASLYSAADVYVINSQGLGETFGRVTIEAMAFGLPVLGTNAGGTKEIVDRNVTGLLHPVGRPGRRTLAQNLIFLLNNPSARSQMGMKGREKVKKMFLKKHMYRVFFDVLFKCLHTGK